MNTYTVNISSIRWVDDFYSKLPDTISYAVSALSRHAALAQALVTAEGDIGGNIDSCKLVVKLES